MKLLSEFKLFQTSSQPKAMFNQFLGITMFLTGLDYFCSMRWSVVFKTFPLKGKSLSVCSGITDIHTQPGMSNLQLKRMIEKKNCRKPLKNCERFSPTKYLFLPLLHSSWILENTILTHINVMLRYVKSQSQFYVSWYHVHSHNITIHLLKL